MAPVRSYCTTKLVVAELVIVFSVAVAVTTYVPMVLFALIGNVTLAIPVLPVVADSSVDPRFGSLTFTLTAAPDTATLPLFTATVMVAYAVWLEREGRE